MKKIFSILVLTYNTPWKKLKLTLDSIIIQTFTDYEIIISDDGSEESLEGEVAEYIKKNNIENIKHLANKTNVGTIKNLIIGLEEAEGTFIRAFGAGDLFFSETSLEEMYTFLIETKAKVAFGMMKGYSFENGKIRYCDVKFPFDLLAYKNRDVNKIARNVILYTDNVPGASMFYEKEYVLPIFKKMATKLTYLEDIFPQYMAMENEYMYMYDDYLIWYECNTGFSTSGNKKWRELLLKDRDAFFELLEEDFPNSEWIKKQHKLKKSYEVNNPYLRILRMAFVYPSILVWALSHYIQLLCGVYKGKKKDGLLNNELLLVD